MLKTIELDSLSGVAPSDSLKAGLINLSEREDEKTVQKVKNLELPVLNTTAPPLMQERIRSDFKITGGPADEPSDLESSGLEDPEKFVLNPIESDPVEAESILADAISEKLELLSPEEFATLEEKIIENPDKQANYVIRLQQLVAAILSQLQQISDKDKDKVNLLEKEYKLATLNAVELQKELGWSSLKFAAFSFGASFLQFLSPHDSDRAIARAFAEQVCPRFGELYTTDLQAKLTSANNSCQLKMSKYNLLSNAEQSKANDKQQISGVFDKALRGLESAARAG